MDETVRRQIRNHLKERWDRLGFDGLLEEEQDFLVLWELHTEVINGTFDQYLCNSCGGHAANLLKTLERLGSVQVLAVVRRVLAALPGGWCSEQNERCKRVAAVPDRWLLFRALTDQYHDAILAEAAVVGRAEDFVQSAYRRESLLT